jgi:hypothetical protein
MTLVFDEKDGAGDVEKATFSKIRIQKIKEYAERQKKRTAAEKENDFQDIDEFQNEWVEARMKGPRRSRERWDGMIEEWEPWNRFGEPVNRWRRYKLQ